MFRIRWRIGFEAAETGEDSQPGRACRLDGALLSCFAYP